MKRKKIFKYSFIVILLSLILVSCFSSSLGLEEIQLSCNTELTYDINEKIPVTIKTTPDDYEIPESALKSNGGKLYYDKYSNIIFESTKPGTYKIFVELDDIKSNQVTIKIEDKNTIKKKEEEKKKKQQKLNEESKKENLEQIENLNNETVETQNIDLNKQQYNQENSNNSNQYTQSNNHHDSTPIEGEVWVSATGSKYHSIPDCGNMNPNKANKITLSEAQSRGLEPCKKCH